MWGNESSDTRWLDGLLSTAYKRAENTESKKMTRDWPFILLTKTISLYYFPPFCRSTSLTSVGGWLYDKHCNPLVNNKEPWKFDLHLASRRQEDVEAVKSTEYEESGGGARWGSRNFLFMAIYSMGYDAGLKEHHVAYLVENDDEVKKHYYFSRKGRVAFSRFWLAREIWREKYLLSGALKINHVGTDKSWLNFWYSKNRKIYCILKNGGIRTDLFFSTEHFPLFPTLSSHFLLA